MAASGATGSLQFWRDAQPVAELLRSGTTAGNTVQFWRDGQPVAVVFPPRSFTLSLAGAVAPSGVASRQSGKPLAGTLLPGGALGRQLAKLLAGQLTPGGALGTVFTAGRPLHIEHRSEIRAADTHVGAIRPELP